MISQLAITFVGWLALVLAGMNLVGMLVRGLVLVADVEDQISKRDATFKKVAGEIYNAKTERKVNLVALVLVIVYLIALAYFWNIGVTIAAAIIMVARVPDLLWEMKYGRQNIKRMPIMYSLTTLIMIAAFPVLWYSLY
jgi:Flp pilus assembly protein TadB